MSSNSIQYNSEDIDVEQGDLKEVELKEATQTDDESVQSSKTIQPTDPNKGLTSEQVQQALEQYGPNEIPVHSTPIYWLFVKQFIGFLPLLIELAAVVSFAAQDWQDGLIIVGILVVNAVLGFREEYHAKKSLDEVSNSLVSEITVYRDGISKTIPTTELVPGDICMLVGGAVVPADIQWIKGDSMSIDTAALTGEPLPRKYPSKEHGSILLSGTTVKSGECYGQVVHTAINTEMGKAQADVMKDKSIVVVSVFQRKIMMVVQALVTISLLVVVAVLLVDGFVYGGFSRGPTETRETLLSALSIMIAAIPVALPLVIQVNMALGASFLSKKHHAIVTSIPALQDIASMSILCSDKTGTLTTANMSIIPEKIFSVNGFTEAQALLFAYLCSNPDKKDDPIDKAVVNAFRGNLEAQEAATSYKQTEIIGFSPEWKRTVAFVTHEDKTYTIAKGLPAKILDTQAGEKDSHEIQWQVTNYNNKAFLNEITSTDQQLSVAGYKTIGVAICEGDARVEEHLVWKFVGLVPMLDPPREDTAQTIASLQHANIDVKMITGDHVNVGRETARLIGMGTNIRAGQDVRNATSEDAKNQMIWEADGFAAVLPSDKRDCVMVLKNHYGMVTGMTGDGVNDAPALSAAQVGIAVEGATDAAKNAADLILTKSGLSPIYGAVLESRRIFARVKAYVVYRVAASIILVLTLATVQFAVGCAVDSLLVIILALLNDISMIPVAYDRASATVKPQLPDAGKLVMSSLFYGITHTALGLTFIFIIGEALGLPLQLTSTCGVATQGFIWLHLVLVTEFAIFSVRAPKFFWQSMPSPILIASVLLTCVGASVVAAYTQDLPTDQIAYIWIFNVVAFIVVDLIKVAFRNMINDAPGGVIESDELLPLNEKTEAEKHVEKSLRNVVHKQVSRPPAELAHTIEVVEEQGLGQFFSIPRPSLTSAFDQRRRAKQLSNMSDMVVYH